MTTGCCCIAKFRKKLAEFVDRVPNSVGIGNCAPTPRRASCFKFAQPNLQPKEIRLQKGKSIKPFRFFNYYLTKSKRIHWSLLFLILLLIRLSLERISLWNPRPICQ